MRKMILIIVISILISAGVMIALATGAASFIFTSLIDQFQVKLNIEDYQQINTNRDNQYGSSYIITNKQDELEIEKQYNINIKDGIDYRKYSLILSENYEINQCMMNLIRRPKFYTKDVDRKLIRICNFKLGDRHKNMIFIYLVKEKNIVSSDEYRL